MPPSCSQLSSCACVRASVSRHTRWQLAKVGGCQTLCSAAASCGEIGAVKSRIVETLRASRGELRTLPHISCLPSRSSPRPYDRWRTDGVQDSAYLPDRTWETSDEPENDHGARGSGFVWSCATDGFWAGRSADRGDHELRRAEPDSSRPCSRGGDRRRGHMSLRE